MLPSTACVLRDNTDDIHDFDCHIAGSTIHLIVTLSSLFSTFQCNNSNLELNLALETVIHSGVVAILGGCLLFQTMVIFDFTRIISILLLCTEACISLAKIDRSLERCLVLAKATLQLCNAISERNRKNSICFILLRVPTSM